MDALRLRVATGLETDKEPKLSVNTDNSLAPSVINQNPNQKEGIAAAALLLFLSLRPSPPPPPPLSLSSPSSSSASIESILRSREAKEAESEISSASEESSSSSSCVSDACSSFTAPPRHRNSLDEVDQIHGDPLRVLALAAAAASSSLPPHASLLRPKVCWNFLRRLDTASVKKARSKIRKRKRQIQELYKMRVVYDLLNSEASKDQVDDDDAPAVFSLPATTTTTTTTATTQAAASSVTATTSHPIRKSAKKDKTSGPSSSLGSTTSRTRSTGSKSVKRRADAILDWLSVVGCASEVKIRSIVGDSPDTSKALRLLVKKDEVKRTGAGGRLDPFLYMVVSKGSTQS